MKTMSRGQLYEHRARERMRKLRGETVKPVGEHGDWNALKSHACHGCGYHVCSCVKQDIRAKVQRFFEDMSPVVDRWILDAAQYRGREPDESAADYYLGSPNALVDKSGKRVCGDGPIVGYAVGDSVKRRATPAADYYLGTLPIVVDENLSVPYMLVDTTPCLATVDERNMDAIFFDDFGYWPAVFVEEWLREFGAVSMGDMRGMCRAWLVDEYARRGLSIWFEND